MVKEAVANLSKERRELEKLATREKILDAAREMFAESGVEATTMRAIADRIGYTATAIYYHYRDKDALLRELCFRDFSQLAKLIGQAGVIKDPIERIRRTGMAYVEFGLQNPSQYRFMFMTNHDPMNHEDIPIDKTNPEESAYAFLQQCVADAVNAQRIRPELCEDPNHITNMLWSVVHGVVSLAMVKCHEPWVEWGDSRKLAEITIETVIRGITVDGQ